MYELFYTWLLPTSLAGTLAAVLGCVLSPLLRRLSWRWQRRMMSGAMAFFLVPVGPLLALLPGYRSATGLEPVGKMLEQAAQTAAYTVQISAKPTMAAPLKQTVEPMRPELAGQLLAILPWLWLLGAALFSLWQLIKYLRFCRMLRRFRCPLKETERQLLRQASLESGRMVSPRAFLCPGIGTPMLTGLIRPTLYLPCGMTGQALELALRHELTHLNGGDLWGKAAMRLACRLHWFNPACHWQTVRLERLCELVCDESAVQGLDKEQRKAYGRVLLAAAAGPLPAGVSGMSDGSKHLKKRLNALFERPCASRSQLLAAGVSVLAAGCLTACAAAGVSASIPVSEAFPQSARLEQVGFLEQHRQQLAAQTVPDPMPEPEEKPALQEGQSRVEWLREEQSVAADYSYTEDASLEQGRYVIDRSAVDGLDEVSGWAFYDEQSLLVDYQEMDRITLQAPVEGIVRYNGTLEEIQYAVEAAQKIGTEGQGDPAGLTLVWPVPGYTHVSRWMSDYHKGADLAAPKGAQVIAMAGGQVTTAGWHYSYGNYVIIDHGSGNRSLYAHLDTLNVEINTQVEQGAVIGTVGSTGNTTGNLCHVEVYVNGERRDLHDWFPDA